MAKQRVAVLFGGRSPEHDVSIVTGLQVLNALDTAKYEAFPVYIATDGAWLIGDGLRNRASYLPDEAARDAVADGDAMRLQVRTAKGWVPARTRIVTSSTKCMAAGSTSRARRR